MFERWTDNFRAVLSAARRPGRRTLDKVSEGDILRAIVEAPESLGTRLLNAAGVDLRRLQVGLRPSIGFDLIHLIEEAGAESRRRGDRWVGTEHLLLALARYTPSHVSDLLSGEGASLERLEQILEEARQQGPPPLSSRLRIAWSAFFNWIRKR